MYIIYSFVLALRVFDVRLTIIIVLYYKKKQQSNNNNNERNNRIENRNVRELDPIRMRATQKQERFRIQRDCQSACLPLETFDWHSWFNMIRVVVLRIVIMTDDFGTLNRRKMMDTKTNWNETLMSYLLTKNNTEKITNNCVLVGVCFVVEKVEKNRARQHTHTHF